MRNSGLLLSKQLSDFYSSHILVSILVWSNSKLVDVNPFLGHLEKRKYIIVKTDHLRIEILVLNLNETPGFASIQQIESLTFLKQFDQKIGSLRIPLKMVVHRCRLVDFNVHLSLVLTLRFQAV